MKRTSRESQPRQRQSDGSKTSRRCGTPPRQMEDHGRSLSTGEGSPPRRQLYGSEQEQWYHVIDLQYLLKEMLKDPPP